MFGKRPIPGGGGLESSSSDLLPNLPNLTKIKLFTSWERKMQIFAKGTYLHKNLIENNNGQISHKIHVYYTDQTVK